MSHLPRLLSRRRLWCRMARQASLDRWHSMFLHPQACRLWTQTLRCEMPPKPDALGCAEEVRFVRSSRGVYHVARADLTPACGTLPARADCVSGSSSGGEILQTCSLRLWEVSIGTSRCNRVFVFSVLCRRQRVAACILMAIFPFFQFWVLKGSAEPRGPPFNEIRWTVFRV